MGWGLDVRYGAVCILVRGKAASPHSRLSTACISVPSEEVESLLITMSELSSMDMSAIYDGGNT